MKNLRQILLYKRKPKNAPPKATVKKENTAIRRSWPDTLLVREVRLFIKCIWVFLAIRSPTLTKVKLAFRVI